MTVATGRLALLGGSPVVSDPPPRYPVVSRETQAAVAALLDDGPMLGLGKRHPAIGACEAALASYHEVEHCLGTSTGHGALHAALIGLELTDGAEVLTSPYSWGVSVGVILHNGAIPRFADVDPETGLLDPDAVEAAIDERTAAILVPHIYGTPADMTRLMAIADRRGIPVIEDASQAHGARHRGRLVGTFGRAAGFSCNGIKPIAAGEAGFLLTGDADVHWRAVVSCAHPGRAHDDLPGRLHDDGFPERLRSAFDSLTYTYRLSTIGALLVRGQLPRLDVENAERRANAVMLRQALDDLSLVRFPALAPDDESAVHMLTLSVPDELDVGRDAVRHALAAEGVNAISYLRRPLNHLERLSPRWSGPRVSWTDVLRRADYDPEARPLPGAERMCRTSIQIPWNLVEPDPARVARVAEAFHKVDANLPALRRWAAERGG